MTGTLSKARRQVLQQGGQALTWPHSAIRCQVWVRSEAGRAPPGALLDLREHLAGSAEAFHCQRHAGIDGNLVDDGLDLVLGDAVAQRALQMQLPLVHAVEAREHDE